MVGPVHLVHTFDCDYNRPSLEFFKLISARSLEKTQLQDGNSSIKIHRPYHKKKRKAKYYLLWLAFVISEFLKAAQIADNASFSFCLDLFLVKVD